MGELIRSRSRTVSAEHDTFAINGAGICLRDALFWIHVSTTITFRVSGLIFFFFFHGVVLDPKNYERSRVGGSQICCVATDAACSGQLFISVYL